MTWSANPIITREVRARWRTWGSPILLLIFLSGLALAMGASYSENMRQMHDDRFSSGAASRSGREIFLVLAMVQAGAWMLLAPVLTAMNIAGERERGLLESLQLSPLRPWQIIAGKLFSAVAFIALMALVTLPVIGLTFLMGGVSPAEFFGVFALHGCIAVAGASVGMFCSARSRRPLGALISSVVMMGIWFFGSGFALYIGQEGVHNLWPFYDSAKPGSTTLTSFLTECAQWFSFTNPLLSTFMLANPRELARGGGMPLPANPDFPYWLICPAFCVGVSVLCWWSAMRAVRKPFADAVPNDHHWLQLRGVRSKSGAGPNSTVLPKVENIIVREIPLNTWVKFRNPILRREVRGAFRFRRAKAWQGLAQLVFAALVFGGLILMAVYARIEPSVRRDYWEMLTNIGLFLLIASCALWSARSFTRDRENGMAEGLSLSLMSPREIVTAKLFAPLLTLAIFSLPVVFTLLFCIDWFNAQTDQYNIPPNVGDALCCFAVIVATCWLVTAFGLLVSHINTRTTNAVIIVIVSLLLAWGVAPIFIEPVLGLFFTSVDYQMTNGIISVWNPFGALNDVINLDYDYNPPGSGAGNYNRMPNGTAWLFCFLAFSGGCFFLLVLLARFHKSMPHARRALNNLVPATPLKPDA